MPQRPQVEIWISNITDEKDSYGHWQYYAFQSVCTMLASSLARLIWYQFGPNATFIVIGAASVLILFYFVISTSKKKVVFTLKLCLLVYKTQRKLS
jgi:hypothetical protein